MKQNKGKFYTAVTGGIGSGKSTVMRIIAEMGYPIFSADDVARNIYDDKEVLSAMCVHFSDCFSSSNVLDRKKLAACVFSDAQRLRLLDGITHPVIMRKMFSEGERANGRFVFFEVPLLFEGGYERLFDRVIIVMRDEAVRIGAVSKRDGLSEEEVRARIKNQVSYEKKLLSGHTVIYNDGDIPALYDRVAEVVHGIVAENN